MSSRSDVDFMKEQIFGWIGNLMRDLDAQGAPVDLDDVTLALEQVAYMLDQPAHAEISLVNANEEGETGKATTLAVGPLTSACSDSTVVIPHWLTAVVESLRETAKPDSVRESLRRGGKRAGIALNPHMLRHWYAPTLIENGVALPVVQRQMRHSDIAVTLRTYVQSEAGGSIHDLFG